MALVDQAGDTTLDVDQDAVVTVTLRFELRLGAVRVLGGSVRVTVEELTTAQPLFSFPSDESNDQAVSDVEPTMIN